MRVSCRSEAPSSVNSSCVSTWTIYSSCRVILSSPVIRISNMNTDAVLLWRHRPYWNVTNCCSNALASILVVVVDPCHKMGNYEGFSLALSSHLSTGTSPNHWGGALLWKPIPHFSPCLQKSCSVSSPIAQGQTLLSSVQSLSHVQLFETPWTAACQASLSITNSQTWFKVMSSESVMPSNHLILGHPLLFPPSIFPSIRVFSNQSVLRRWPKDWSFSFSISPSSEYSGLISFWMDWLDLLAVQDFKTLKSVLQHHSSKASILWCSAFFMVHIHTWPLEKP